MLYYLIHVIACCHMSIQHFVHLMCAKKNQTLSDSMLVHMVQDTFNTLQEERVIVKNLPVDRGEDIMRWWS